MLILDTSFNDKVISVFFCIHISIFLSSVTHIVSVSDFPLFWSNSAQKCFILQAECSPQNSLILLEILPAEFTRQPKWVSSRDAFRPRVINFRFTSVFILGSPDESRRPVQLIQFISPVFNKYCSRMKFSCQEDRFHESFRHVSSRGDIYPGA